MSHVLEGRVILQRVAHHSVLWGRVRITGRGAHHLVTILIFLVHVLLAHEIFGAFVFMRSAILHWVSMFAWRVEAGCIRIDTARLSH